MVTHAPLPGPTEPQGKLDGGSLVLKFGDEAPAGRRTGLLEVCMLLDGAHINPQAPLVSLM